MSEFTLCWNKTFSDTKVILQDSRVKQQVVFQANFPGSSHILFIFSIHTALHPPHLKFSTLICLGFILHINSERCFLFCFLLTTKVNLFLSFH